MKNVILLTAVAVSMMFASCSISKNVASNSSTKETPLFTGSEEIPAAEYDNEDSFGATGTAYGPKTRLDVLQRAALANAQGLIRQKMQHAYKGAIDDYIGMIGNNAGSDAEMKLEGAGTQIIDVIVNNTSATQVRFSNVDEKGNVTCFVGVRVDKKAMAEKIADNVSEDEELKIRFKEEEFRKKMEENFKKFKDDKK